MKAIIPWLGYIVICAWVATFLTALTMMWDPSWMDKENEPLGKTLTIVIHSAAVCLGICLGPALFLDKVRNQLNGFHKASYVLAFGLAAVSLYRILF